MDDLFNFHLSVGHIFARLALATLCGGILGWERQFHRRPAGLRTYMMVCLGSAGFVLASEELAMITAGVAALKADPLRSIQGVIQGIGFLGAGSVIQARGQIHGITTAAGIWVVGGIGVCCGAGLYGLALIYTLFALIILTVFFKLERRMFAEDNLSSTHVWRPDDLNRDGR